MTRSLPFSFALALALTTALPAQIPLGDESLRPKIAELAGELIGKDGSPGVVVGIVRGGQRQVFAFGKPTRKSDVQLDGDSLFEIGSITKVFTCLALAELVGSGGVRLEQPVQELLPESVVIPRGEEREIRLVDLATHLSGLPRMPDNMRPTNPLNPYADYTVEAMYEFLSDHELRRDVGIEFEYSNLGMGLLGHALALRAGTDYESLLRDRICGPLRLKDTVIELSEAQRARLARGHLRNGIPTQCWDLPTLAGAGALHSSVNDLMAFAAACLEPPNDEFAAALELTMEPRHGRANAGWIGLGWHIQGEGRHRTWWHNGATGGYSSFLGFNPKTGIAVVVLSNRQRGGPGPSPGDLGAAIVRLVAQ